MDINQPLGSMTPLSMEMDFSLTSPIDSHSADPNKRRSSSRSIKRKKFDDELVEYSCLSTKDSDPTTNKKPPKQKSMLQTYYEQPSSSNASFTFPQTAPEKRNRILPRPAAKKSKSKNKPSQFSTKDLGRWKPTDDLALINAVLQSNDLRLVHIGVKFSCKFTLQEIQHRWYALLYDPIISKLATAAMKNLHPDVVANVESKTLYSKEEQQLLASVSATPMPSTATFDELLKKNSLIFHKARTPKALMSQWQLMKQYYLLDEQTVPRSLAEKIVVPFSELEENINDNDLAGVKDDALDDELALMDRRDKKEIRTLESEVARWQVLVDAVSGITPHEFDMHTLAVLKGRLVRYLMRSRQITIGRSSKDGPVDVDLTLEGPATKVSRQQGTIRLRNNGDFFIMNEGKRPIFVDGRPILANNKYRLNDNSVVEIAGLRFVFLVNTELISVIRQEAAKMNLGG